MLKLVDGETRIGNTSMIQNLTMENKSNDLIKNVSFNEFQSLKEMILVSVQTSIIFFTPASVTSIPDSNFEGLMSISSNNGSNSIKSVSKVL